jgi:DNA polymerase-1
MKVIPFSPDHDKMRIGILIKDAAMEEAPLKSYYVDRCEALGIPKEQLVAIGVRYDANNKVNAKDGKEYAVKLLKVVDSLKLDTLLVADTNYYKFLTKITKTTTKLGAVEPCAIPGYEHINVLLSVNYQALYYNDRMRFNLDESVRALANFKNSGQVKIGTNIIKKAVYPKSIREIRHALVDLMRYGALTCDVETFSLRFQHAGLGTIAFGTDKHRGVAFDVSHTESRHTQTILRMLKDFFNNYKGHLVFHNALFDVKILVYTLYMDHPKDYIGMQEGLDTFKKIHDTMVLTYIATNSTAGNKLGLKENTLEFTGDYAEDEIADIRKIKLKPLLKYNLIDCLATWYLLDKHDAVLQDPKLAGFYKTIAQPSLIPTIKMMLVGLPLDMDQVFKTEAMLQAVADNAMKYLIKHILIRQAEKLIAEVACVAANKKLKKLVKTPNQFVIPFNPGSDNHLRILIHDVMGLPIVDRTKTKMASTKAKVLERHIHRTNDIAHKKVLEALIEIAGTSIILTNFIKNFKELAFYKKPGEPWLNGNLKTTGTQGLRYSSSDPNMQNMPSTSQYAKFIKACFRAPKGWCIGGADFASLEDRINAILTQDPNKIKVYTDGYDGHCLRAFSYFGHLMSNIIDNVAGINSIAKKYPELRQKSKTPTFALTYEGTWFTLVKNLGLTESEAKSIEKNYHELYKVSDAFAKKNIDTAAQTGHVELAFGAKLRTPVLRQSILNSVKTPYEAVKEGRSANNAVTQSWGVLTNRAVIEFEERLAKRPDLIPFVLICNVIHDAIYVLMKKEAKVIKWVNDNLIECMRWNDHPAIKSKTVPMEAELDIGPDLGHQIRVPNHATTNEIEVILSGTVF